MKFQILSKDIGRIGKFGARVEMRCIDSGLNRQNAVSLRFLNVTMCVTRHFLR
jgi:hypothetical protein